MPQCTFEAPILIAAPIEAPSDAFAALRHSSAAPILHFEALVIRIVSVLLYYLIYSST